MLLQIVRKTSLSISATARLNLQLIQVGEYLQQFDISVQYKLGAQNKMPDTLSHLENKEAGLPTDNTLDLTNMYPAEVESPQVQEVLLQMSSDFLERIHQGYTSNPQWMWILKVL